MKKPLHFEIVSRYDRKWEPATAAVPFARGELKPEDVERLRIHNCAEDEKIDYPAQFRATAFWDDHSVKWLLVHFLADLPAEKEADYEICLSEYETFGTARDFVMQKEGRLVLDNGVMRVCLSKPGENGLFHEIVTKEHTYSAGSFKGPVMVDAEGREYTVVIGEDGWEIVEDGPVKVTVRAKGCHISGEKKWFDHTLLVTLWAGKPWLNLDYQMINREDNAAGTQHHRENEDQYPFEYVKEIRMEILPEAGDCAADAEEGGTAYQLYASDDISFGHEVERAAKGESLFHLITADSVVNTASEMFPEVLFGVFMADWKNKKYGISAGIYQAYQNFPKALRAGGDGITLYLLPQTDTLLKVPQGVARTTHCYICFHTPELSEEALLDRALMFETPPVPVAETREYMEAGVFEDYVSDRYHHETERFLYRYVDSRAKGLGMLNFGDGPEWEYMKQGRSAGKLIWINNEYDMPHNFMIMLARTGDRRYFDYMKASVEHWYDVDLCHYSQLPNREGLLWKHSVDHVTGKPIPSHQWVEGFLDYYHMTGDPQSLEAACSIGEGLLKLMELPVYHTAAAVAPREIGWAMRTFMALYRETYEERWKEACLPIVQLYVEWAKQQGTWASPYPGNYMNRVPFMIHVGIVGMYQYYQMFPQEEIKDTILQVVDDVIRYCYIPRADLFFGKQFPSIRFLNTNGMVLESMAIAYQLSQDPAYIEKGLGMFDWITKENQPPIYDFSKYKHDDYTVIYNCPAGPKRSAQTLLPLLHYYKCAVELGYIKNREESR